MYLSYCRSFVELNAAAADTHFTAHCDLDDAADLMREFREARLHEIRREVGVANIVEPEEIEILRYCFDTVEDGEDHIDGEIWVRNRSLVGSAAPGSTLERVGHFFDRVDSIVRSMPRNKSLDWGIAVPFNPVRFTPVVLQLFHMPLDLKEENRLHMVRLKDGNVADLGGAHWPDYLALGLNETHVPELIRICTEPDLNVVLTDLGNSDGIYHAVRALGRIATPQAVSFLLSELGAEHDDLHESLFVDAYFYEEELERALASLGTPVLDQLLHMLNDENASDLRIHCAAYALARLATLHPEHRAPVVSALIVSLETTGQTDFDLVTTFASLLLDMRAVEAADAIGRGFAEGRIDKDIFRDWQRAREEMGLS